MKTLQGEWWIIDGKLTFADGDVATDGPVINHIAIVLEYLHKDLLRALRVADHPWPELASSLSVLEDVGDTDPTMLRTIICEWSDGACRDGSISEEDYDDTYGAIERVCDWTPEKLCALIDSSTENVDPRDWSIEHLGWIRLAENSIQLWKLTPSSMRIACEGAIEATRSECRSISLAWSEHFDIEENSTRSFYRSVPLVVLESAKPSAMRDYYER